MRIQGKITRWDDERGFGFISWYGDGRSIFVHITAFSGTSRRPEVGDLVFYEVAEGKDGKSRAEKVRFSDQPEPQRRSAGPRKRATLPVISAYLFVCFVVASAYFNRISWLVVGAYVAMSLATFVAYGRDKLSARRGNWRTSEADLHLLGLVGGWPGGLAAQRLLRHKSSKSEFLAVFWLTAIINAGTTGYLVWRGETEFIMRWINEVSRSAA